MSSVATIGYERSDGDSVVAALRQAGVDLLVDVRMVPFSHKPGFAQGPLKALLQAAGIEYMHVAELGNPKEGRDAAKAGDDATFRRVYAERMATAPAQRAILRIAELGRVRTPCLMCFERDHDRCHRGMVAEAVEAQGLRIVHLKPAETVKTPPRKAPAGKPSPADQGTLF